MRFNSCGRIGMAGTLVAFVFALSANAQTDAPSAPKHLMLEASQRAVDANTRGGSGFTGIGLNGSELFKHQWKPTEPSNVGALVGDPRLAEDEGLLQSALPRGIRGRRFSGTWQFRTGDGLGPLHNASSCADCHPGGGASGVEHNVTLITIDPRSVAVQVADKEHGKQIFELFPSLLNEDGTLSIETVVHDQSTSGGYAAIRNRLASYVPSGIDDAWFKPASRTSEAIAKQPVIAGRHTDVDFYLSQRNSPPLFGLGFIDRISVQRLAGLAKKQARESGGKISGRVAMKFGWRGQIASVSAFVSQACAGELGLTQLASSQPGDPVNLNYQPPGIDMSFQDVTHLTNHVSSLPVPTENIPPGRTWQEVSQGESTFNAVGCASCHVPDVYPALNIFSDLLLHDMGDELQAASPAPLGDQAAAGAFRPPTYAAKGPFSGGAPAYYSDSMSQTIPRAETIEAPETPQFPRGARPRKAAFKKVSVFSKSGQTARVSWDDLQREWRTPPLWGIADTAPYLHDGRASTLDEAIRWHGGEAKSSRDKFVSLDESEKTNLRTFLLSLQAPDEVQPPGEDLSAEVEGTVQTE